MLKLNVRRKDLHLLIGPALFVLCAFLLPNTAFPKFSERAAIGTIVWMAYWWITGPVDYAVTAFLPIAVNALFSLIDMSTLIANYASETILLLIGACLLAVSWEETGLDKRIASTFLVLIGPSLKLQIIFWFVFSAVLSAVLPNSVVCAVLTPIAVSMLKYVGEGDISKSKIGSIILLTVAWGVGIGGLASPLGGAMNLVVVDYIQKVTGKEYMYIDWVVRFAPIMLVLLVSNIAYLLIIRPRNADLTGSKEYFVRLRKSMGKMSRNEILCLMLFLAATILAFTRNLYSSLLPGLKPAYVFIICAILSFFLRRADGTKLMVWGTVQKKIAWGLFFIYGGGLAVGTLISGTGADKAIGKMVSSMGLSGGFLLVFVIVAITIVLSDVTSNTATAAVCLPIVISLVSGMNLNPIPYIYAATIGINVAYMFPTSIRAIPVGYGLSPSYMFKKGSILLVLTCILMSAVAWLLITYWPAFSVA